jgi:competence protein ComEC
MLAGATIHTQRAFVMTGIVLVAILVNRTGISLRLVAWAALIILLLRPEALLSVSFQMSFAAVIAFVAACEGLAGRFRRSAATSSWTRRVLMYFVAIVFSSLIASLATAPFAVFHFNRFAPMGLVVNLLAVPITALWVMPLEVLTLLLMPLGLEGLILPVLGWGVETVLWIARTVASWPGAAITVAQPTVTGMILAATGGLWLCLWRRGWRYVGIPLIVAGLATAGSDDPPDILVSGNANLIAFRANSRCRASVEPAGVALCARYLATPSACR